MKSCARPLRGKERGLTSTANESSLGYVETSPLDGVVAGSEEGKEYSRGERSTTGLSPDHCRKKRFTKPRRGWAGVVRHEADLPPELNVISKI